MLRGMATSTCPTAMRWRIAKRFANAHRNYFIAIPVDAQLSRAQVKSWGSFRCLLQPRLKSTILAVSSDFPAITRPWLRQAALRNHTVRFVDDQPTCDLTDTRNIKRRPLLR